MCTPWRQALRVVGGEIEAVAQVRVQDSLPQDLAGFTGRTDELDRLRHARAGRGEAVVISAIEGMAGVGKTQLAVHAGHLLHREQPFDRVLFVNLRGFHPDPAQPPADPAAVLDGFLRLLGVPGQQIPHDLDAPRRRLPRPARRHPGPGRAGQRRHRRAGPPAAAGHARAASPWSPAGAAWPTCPGDPPGRATCSPPTRPSPSWLGPCPRPPAGADPGRRRPGSPGAAATCRWR